jgi:Domain of Unknown Function (DUF326)
MSYAEQMLGAVPSGIKPAVKASLLTGVIDAFGDCVQACVADIDADLNEPNLHEMVACIRLCENCADVCAAMVRVLSRRAGWDARVVQPMLDACVTVCRSCGDESERHAAMHSHCRVCATACFRCEQACGELLAAMR